MKGYEQMYCSQNTRKLKCKARRSAGKFTWIGFVQPLKIYKFIKAKRHHF